MGEKYNDPRNKNQIFKQYGNNCFFEVLGPTPEFTKVTFHFVKFNERTKKIEEDAYHYVSFIEMLTLCRQIDTGVITKASEMYKKEGKDIALWRKQGGTPARSNKEQPIGRVLSVIPSKKMSGVVFKSEEGTGEMEGKGLIKLLYNKDVRRILVPVPYDTLYGMSAYIKMRLQAYTDWMQMNGFYGSFNGKNPENVGEAEKEKTPDEPETPEGTKEETSDDDDRWHEMRFEDLGLF